MTPLEVFVLIAAWATLTFVAGFVGATLKDARRWWRRRRRERAWRAYLASLDDLVVVEPEPRRLYPELEPHDP